MKHPQKQKRRSRILGGLLGLFVFVQFFGVLLFPRPVHAQLATAQISSLPNEIDNVLEQYWRNALRQCARRSCPGSIVFYAPTCI